MENNKEFELDMSSYNNGIEDRKNINIKKIKFVQVKDRYGIGYDVFINKNCLGNIMYDKDMGEYFFQNYDKNFNNFYFNSLDNKITLLNDNLNNFMKKINEQLIHLYNNYFE